MAILGFLTLTSNADAPRVEKEFATFPELTTYGIHSENNIVTVAETSAMEMEGLMRRIRAVEGVIAVSVTSYTIEDEVEDMTTSPAAV